jgi:3-oxoacyl-[acyl-carrier protein] reductase
MSAPADKVALVTGGSRGIGAAIARRLAADGADVALTYVQAADAAAQVVGDIDTAGRRGLALAADSTDADAVVAAVERTVAELGRLDVLVNNAGIGMYGTVDELTLADVDRTLATHARSAFVAAQAAARHMGPGGRIVNVGSTLAERVPTPGWSAYAMSKSALLGLTKGLARDLGPRQITVNLVQPGPVDTDMNPADGPDADGERGFVALGRFGTVDEVASVVAHLASDEGRYVTGASVSVDGGWAA